jgi:hypothetical protein
MKKILGYYFLLYFILIFIMILVMNEYISYWRPKVYVFGLGIILCIIIYFLEERLERGNLNG